MSIRNYCNPPVDMKDLLAIFPDQYPPFEFPLPKPIVAYSDDGTELFRLVPDGTNTMKPDRPFAIQAGVSFWLSPEGELEETKAAVEGMRI